MGPSVVLVADPVDDDREQTIETLQSDPELTIRAATNLAEATEIITELEQDLDCLVTEYTFPDGTGISLVETVRTTAPEAGCVLYTTATREEIRAAGHEAVIIDYLHKDIEDVETELRDVVGWAVDTRLETSYPIGDNEVDRLALLDRYDLSDPDLHASLHRVIELAAAHFDLPYASINILDETSQDFLVCYGADWTTADRQDSVCTYTMLEDGRVSSIADILDDPRFASVEALQDMGIRFYAGATLERSDGLAIGTLCVYDRDPGRTFSPADEMFLARLADIAMDLIELYQGASTDARDRGTNDVLSDGMLDR
ncbi:MAG: GAF domain-containing protein [Halobacteriales archaeon]|nr:GAF domain-containing protein [Halobacteriales archaeon]